MPEHSVPGRSSPSLRVLKFGGSSVGTRDGLRNAVQIIRRATDACWPVVVVSAAGGVTDRLVQAADDAPHAPSSAERWAERIGARYRQLAGATIRDASLWARYEAILQARVTALRRSLSTPLPSSSAARDAVLAVGERLMGPLLVGVLVDAGIRAQAVDAASLIRTDATHGAAAVDGPSTRAQIREEHAQWGDAIPVVPGFIGSTADGVTTTLGRGGSDYSAALLAQGLGAERVERWTDVEGLYTCDPADNENARRLSRIEMEKAQTWAQNGRLGFHPRMLDPLVAAGIPLRVRCAHRSEAPGTRVVPSLSTSCC